MDTLSNTLLKEILINKNNNYSDNYDPWMRYEAEFSTADKSTSLYRKRLPVTENLAKQLNITYRIKDFFSPVSFYKNIIQHFSDISLLYDLLNDNQSKQLLIKLLAYRILGYKKVKLPRNTKKYWDDIDTIRKLNSGKDNININFLNLELVLMDLASIGYKVKLNATAEGVAATFVQQQYAYENSDFILKADKDDVVLDCGACWGDTTLYFAHEVGCDGKVYAFEFLPENIKILRQNIERNPDLKNRIEVVMHPVWDVSKKILNFVDHGPGTQVREHVNQQNTQACETIAIDDFVEQFNVSKVDFIKMDIEGAELNALRGAEKTLRKFKPKLAISAYHKPDDFVTLPSYLLALDLGYEFYLEHHTIHKWETVLYATTPERKKHKHV